MSDLHEAALRAGVFGYIEARAKELKDQARQELKALPNGDTVAGRVNDQVVCKASWSKGRTKVVVTDEQAFLEWVKKNHPTEVVESVNPAYLKSLKAVGEVVIDSDGVPAEGVVVVSGEPSITVRSTDDAPFLVANLLSSGLVGIDGLKAVTDGS